MESSLFGPDDSKKNTTTLCRDGAACESTEPPLLPRRPQESQSKLRLYHYCCSHSARAITRRGFLQPQGRPFFPVDLVWLTDQNVPNREGLGLTSHTLPCDRLEFQYVVDVDAAVVTPWLQSDVRVVLARDPGFHEFEDGRQPETWWIAYSPVFAIQNRAYSAARARA